MELFQPFKDGLVALPGFFPQETRDARDGRHARADFLSDVPVGQLARVQQLAHLPALFKFADFTGCAQVPQKPLHFVRRL